MKNMAFEVAGRRYEYAVPERWGELTPGQFEQYAERGEVDAESVRRMLGLADVVAASLWPADWWVVVREMEWMRDTERVDSLVMDEIEVGGERWYGYNADFSDVSWEEWMYAERYATAGRWDVVAAVLYRPEREGWDRESDRRVPFTKYGAEARAERAGQIGERTIRAVAANYLLLRRRLTGHYRHLFYEPTEEELQEGRQRQATDWLGIIRSMMGDNFYEEGKYLGLSVPSVLYQLESRVREGR